MDRVKIARFAPRFAHVIDGRSNAAEIFVTDELLIVFLPGEIHIIDDALPVTPPFFVEVTSLVFDAVFVVLELFEFLTEFFAESGDGLADGAQLIVWRARASAQDGRNDGQDGFVFGHLGGHVGGRMGHDG